MGLQPLRSALERWEPGRRVGADPLHAIATAWPAIVGADVAAHSAPQSLSGTMLVVATRSSAWSQQLQFLSPAILAGIRELRAGAAVERIVFRAGAFRAAARGSAPGATAARRRALAVRASPAGNLEEAFERLRRRMTAQRAGARRVCAGCSAPVGPGAGDRCAPCTGEAERTQELAAERALYAAPWSTPAELREQLPEVSALEIERVRKRLLQRWWHVLERFRRSERRVPSDLERNVASSYVLLHSRLPPDRLTPAVVRNLVGPELEALLWPPDAPVAAAQRRGDGASPSKETVR